MYNKKILIRYVSILVMVMLAMFVTRGVGFLIVVPLIFMAMFKGKPEELFFYLLLTVAMVMGNQYLMPKPMIFAVAQRGMMILIGGIMLCKLGGQRNSRAVKPLLMMLLYLLAVSLSSINGWSPLISFLKMFLFVMVYMAYYGISNEAANANSPNAGIKIRCAVLAFSIFFIFGSLLLIPFPGISQLSGADYQRMLMAGGHVTSLFKGMTMHSQSLGPAIAILFTLILGDLVFSIKKPDKLYLALLLISPILIYKTSSRTAMGSMLAGAIVVLWYVMVARGIGARWRGKVIGWSLGIISFLSIVALAIPSVRTGILNYALKFGTVSEGQEVSMDEVLATRQGKWQEGIYNFKKSPFIGNGFQVSEEMQGKSAQSIKDILTAPIEKSVWVSAILEESGALGFTVFILFIVVVLGLGSQRKMYIGNSTFIVLITTNFGEFTVFSMSYTGGLLWAAVFAGYVLDAQRQKQPNRIPYYPQNNRYVGNYNYFWR